MPPIICIKCKFAYHDMTFLEKIKNLPETPLTKKMTLMEIFQKRHISINFKFNII